MTYLRALILSLGLAATLAAGSDKQAEVSPAATTEETPPPTISELINTLEHGPLQQAFDLLRKDYIHRENFTSLEINRAALQGMLERLNFGAMLLDENSISARNSPFDFYHSLITKNIGYIRFGRYRAEDLEPLDAALKSYQNNKDVSHLIVDLRSPQQQADFSIATQILSRFAPAGELLFKIRRPDQQRDSLFMATSSDVIWSKGLILLVDEETGNVGEIIAASLRKLHHALIIGRPTPGLTVEYQDVTISEDRVLRYAIAEVVLADDTSFFQTGVIPDIDTPTDKSAKNAIFHATQKGGSLEPYLFAKPRPRLNEAALVARMDPELDYFLLRSQRKPTPWDQAPPVDRALRQAVDLLTGTAFLEAPPRIRR